MAVKILYVCEILINATITGSLISIIAGLQNIVDCLEERYVKGTFEQPLIFKLENDPVIITEPIFLFFLSFRFLQY